MPPLVFAPPLSSQVARAEVFTCSRRGAAGCGASNRSGRYPWGGLPGSSHPEPWERGIVIPSPATNLRAPVAERQVGLPPTVQQREHIMRQRAEIEARRVVARRLFDALTAQCAQYPDKYIYLIQPCDLAEDATAADPPADSGAARSDPTEGGQSRLILN
jgi:hypothetical protein